MQNKLEQEQRFRCPALLHHQTILTLHLQPDQTSTPFTKAHTDSVSTSQDAIGLCTEVPGMDNCEQHIETDSSGSSYNALFFLTKFCLTV